MRPQTYHKNGLFNVGLPLALRQGGSGQRTGEIHAGHREAGGIFHWHAGSL